ncbi:hypothetical protein [Stenotrophomonas sp. ZAC14D2_NAIMI4_7]|uniref:hypothetical protein n=1 Tax=Stenotrophomonas sp. ZAC14D2_NAIMI4_7 TaxID=2072405 RepID=UPI00131F43A4|nr:hypothetical protein [Stenotrophomonas sp. ZAC14D2_NAIMI4_7]
MGAKIHKPADARQSLKALDDARRAREMAAYKNDPARPMPVVFKVRENGGKIAWPHKFR